MALSEEMDKPLLGPRRRADLPFLSNLGQVPEDSPSRQRVFSPIETLKERLIYGSCDDSGPSEFAWNRQQARSDWRVQDDLEAKDEVFTRRSLFKGSLSSPQQMHFNDFFTDNKTSVSDSSRRRFLADLTRAELDVHADSPRLLSSVSPSRIHVSSPHKEGPGEEQGAEPDKTLPPTPVRVDILPSRFPENPSGVAHSRQFYRSKTAPALILAEGEINLGTKRSPPPVKPISIVSQAVLGLVLYLVIGVVIYTWKEDEFSGQTSTLHFVDAIYFCIVTLCTIGYGDIAPNTTFAKLFACVYVLVGFGFVDILLSGMVNQFLDSQEALLLNAVSAGHNETAKSYLVDVKKGRMRIRMKFALAFGVLIVCIGVGALVIHFVETLGWLDSFYLACMSVTTVGYGDHAFKTSTGRLFASFWLLVSTLAVARSFLYLAEARIEKRNRLLAKRVLEEDMTIGDLAAADWDNNGSVRYTINFHHSL
ncbi:hypothetical protein KP509_06G059200 [Ceratopteris richardii]|uniref:Potassium channel domain-containing protein n=1 Tax=Ceratopteris richardii TaxID=49495 RepID=A0A8T2UL83_CERRI|nr:hypothetical protein KP509_06G059200 [Ceratopteris richardii]